MLKYVVGTFNNTFERVYSQVYKKVKLQNFFLLW